MQVRLNGLPFRQGRQGRGDDLVRAAGSHGVAGHPLDGRHRNAPGAGLEDADEAPALDAVHLGVAGPVGEDGVNFLRLARRIGQGQTHGPLEPRAFLRVRGVGAGSVADQRGIGLRAYGQQDPIVAYRMESYDMFDEMSNSIREDTVRQMLTIRIRSERETQREQVAKITSTSGAGSDGSEKGRTVRKAAKTGPNQPCPCGSGKKYKNCCGDVRKN